MPSKLSCAKPTVFKIKEWKHSEWKYSRLSKSLWYTEPRREGGQYGTPLYKLYRYVQLFLLKLGIEFNRVDVKYGKVLCSFKPSSLNNL